MRRDPRDELHELHHVAPRFIGLVEQIVKHFVGR